MGFPIVIALLGIIEHLKYILFGDIKIIHTHTELKLVAVDLCSIMFEVQKMNHEPRSHGRNKVGGKKKNDSTTTKGLNLR